MKAANFFVIALFVTLFFLSSQAMPNSDLNNTNVSVGDGIAITSVNAAYPINLTNSSRAFLVFSHTIHSTGPQLFYRGNIINNTEVLFRKNATGSGTTLAWFIAQFDSGLRVLRGNFTINATYTSFSYDLNDSVNLSKAFIMHSFSGHDAGGQTNHAFRANFTNSSVINFTRIASASRIDVEWQVVEFEDNSTVVSGTASMPQATRVMNINLVTPIDVNRSFPIFSLNSNADQLRSTLLRANLTNSTNLQFSRSTTQIIGDITIAWYVITLNNTNASVQQIYAVMPSATARKDNITIPNAVNLSRSIIIHSVNTTGTTYTDDMTTISFVNETVINLSRGSSVNPLEAAIYVIELPYTVTTAPANTCTPVANQDWAINSGDNCTVSGQNINVSGIRISGSDGFVLFQHSNITSLSCSIQPTAGKLVSLFIYPTVSWGNAC